MPMLFRLLWLGILSAGTVSAQGRGGTSAAAPAQPPTAPAASDQAGRGPANNGNDIVLKALSNRKWHDELGDIADIEEIRYTSLPPHKPANPTAPGAKNPLIIHATVLIPKKLDRTK